MIPQIGEYVMQVSRYPSARRKELPISALHIDRADLASPREEVLE